MKKKIYGQIATVTTVITLSGFSSQAFAAKEVKKEQHSDDMVVTATRTEERVIDVPVITEVITREKIEMSGATHVGDLIGKYITGHYHKFNGLLSPVGLRGFRSEAHGDDVKGYVLILIDGHRTGTGNAAKLNVDRIERIEVTKGPSSALYGSAAMGGVINIITKKGEGDPTATMSADVGSFGYYKARIAGGGEVNDKFRFYATASYEAVDDYDDPTYGTVYNTEETKVNVGLNLSYAFSQNHDFRIGGNFADLTGEYPSWENGTYSSYSQTTRSNHDKSNGYVDAEYNGDFFDGMMHWRALGYYLWDRNHWNYGDVIPEESQSKYTDTTLGTDQQFTFNLSSWNTLVAGFSIENLEKEAEGVSGGAPSAPYTPAMEYNTQALFLQDSVDLWDNRVNIIGAVRYDRFDLSTKRPSTGSYNSFNEKNETFDHFTPKLGIGVKFLDELLRVRANFGEGFKSPSADQLSAEYTSHTNLFYYGNPDLDPETSRTFDAGVDLYHDLFTLNLGYFHTDYKDKIIQSSTTVNGRYAVTWKNLGDAEIAGIDVMLEWNISRTFGWSANLSLWSNATFNTTKEDKETGDDLNYISDYEVKSGLDLSYAGFSAQLSHVLVGPQMITNYDSYPYSTEEKDSFDFWDLTARYRFMENWEVYGSILNVFDDEVEWVRGSMMPERNFRVGLTYTF